MWVLCDENVAVNCEASGVSEIAKTSLIDLSLACSVATLYGFTGFGVVQEVFSGESDPKMRLGCVAKDLMHYSGSGLSHAGKQKRFSEQACL